ncbi:MAG: hypothetical protein R2759_10895 [Bacteroidales bacterium]
MDPNAQTYNPFELYEQIVTSAQLQSNRYTGFIQNTWNANIDTAKFTLTAGIRANYWDYNHQLVVSPRATISYKPDWKRDILFLLFGRTVLSTSFLP